jgi:hypothetical protein
MSRKKTRTLSRKREERGGDGGTERGCGVKREDVVGRKEVKGVRSTGERKEQGRGVQNKRRCKREKK